MKEVMVEVLTSLVTAWLYPVNKKRGSTLGIRCDLMAYPLQRDAKVPTVNYLDLIRHGDLIHVNNPGHNEDTRVLHWQCLLYIRDKLFSNTIGYALQYVHTS